MFALAFALDARNGRTKKSALQKRVPPPPRRSSTRRRTNSCNFIAVCPRKSKSVVKECSKRARVRLINGLVVHSFVRSFVQPSVRPSDGWRHNRIITSSLSERDSDSPHEYLSLCLSRSFARCRSSSRYSRGLRDDRLAELARRSPNRGSARERNFRPARRQSGGQPESVVSCWLVSPTRRRHAKERKIIRLFLRLSCRALGQITKLASFLPSFRCLPSPAAG